MGHKVNPKSFRIKETADWLSKGFYGKKIPKYLAEDFKIREFLNKKLKSFGVEKIETERVANKTNIIISTARPGLIIGRGGEGVEIIKREVISLVQISPKDKREIRIEIREIKNPWESAGLVGQWIAQQIEKRMPFRRVLKQAIAKVIVNKGVQGVRVEVAGRLDGAEIARTEWLRQGRLPRNTIRADIDFSRFEAHCTYGRVGIKVWIYKGEKFDK